jgi:predicted enzyme related to lactoylglutathione lyase
MLEVTSFSERRRFYGELLGLTEERKPAPLAARGGAWFRGQGVIVHLGIDRDFRPQKKGHPAFVVADLDSVASELERAGHDVTPDTTLPDVWRLYTEDPFGNRIEMIEDGGGGFSPGQTHMDQ